MWIFRGVVVLPGFVVLVGILGEHIAEMVLGCMSVKLQIIWVARLSRLRVLARVDC